MSRLILGGGPTILQTPTQARAMRAEHFNKGNINLSRFLADGLVGNGNSSSKTTRLPLKPNDWAFVYWDEGVYIAKGTVPLSYSNRLYLQFYDSTSASVLLQGGRWRKSTCMASLHNCHQRVVLPGGPSFREDVFEPLPVHTPFEGHHQG